MLITADRIIHDGYAYSDVGIKISREGRIESVGELSQLGKPDRVLDGRVLLPGLVNTHSHAFQRLLRGRSQFLGQQASSFWSWRDLMYAVANVLDAQSLYTVSRQAFIEMLLSGTTTVGEFHYLFHHPDGTPYDNVHELTDAVIQAARDVGIRLSLIRVVYLRGGFDKTLVEASQRRFCDGTVDEACDRFDAMVHRIIDVGDQRISWAIAAHSLRAVGYEALMSLKLRLSHMPFHLHISEQRQEVDECIKHYGKSPVALLASKRLLDSCTTLVHATHLQPGEAQAIADTGCIVCVCPATEADLGDGLVAASDLHRRGVPLCLGTDGQTLSSIMQEAARLEMHERLRVQTRNVLGGRAEGDSTAATLLDMATRVGATALGVESGALRRGKWADLVSYDINDPALLGADDWSLLPALMFSGDSRAVRDVIVGGEFVVQDGHHPLTWKSRQAYTQLCSDIFRGDEDEA